MELERASRKTRDRYYLGGSREPLDCFFDEVGVSRRLSLCSSVRTANVSYLRSRGSTRACSREATMTT